MFIEDKVILGLIFVVLDIEERLSPNSVLAQVLISPVRYVSFKEC